MEYRHLNEEDIEILLRNEDLDLHTWFRRDPVLMKEFMNENNRQGKVL